MKAIIQAGELKAWEFAGLRAIWFGQHVYERLGDPTVILSSFIISNTPAFRMELQWGIPRSEMDEVNILFQDDDPDTYIETMLKRARST